MFSFSAYSTCLPYGACLPYEHDLFTDICDDDNSKNCHGTQDAVLQQQQPQNHSNQTQHTSPLQQQITDVPVNSDSFKMPIGFSGGTMDILDFETGEALAFRKPLSKHIAPLGEGRSIAASSNAPYSDFSPFATNLNDAEKKAAIWMPPRDAETGQPVYNNQSSRTYLSSGKRLPGQRQLSVMSDLSTNMSLDVDTLMNSFEMTEHDSSALDREVTLSELDKLLSNDALNGKGVNQAVGYSQQQRLLGSSSVSAAFDMADMDNFVNSAGDAVLDDAAENIMMPTMQRAPQPVQQRQPSSLVSERWSSGPLADAGQIDSVTAHNNNEVSLSSVAWPYQQQTIISPTDSSGPQFGVGVGVKQEIASGTVPAVASSQGDYDYMTQWLSPSTSFGYDFGQESFVLPTTSQGWRYDLQYVGTNMPAYSAGDMSQSQLLVGSDAVSNAPAAQQQQQQQPTTPDSELDVAIAVAPDIIWTGNTTHHQPTHISDMLPMMQLIKSEPVEFHSSPSSSYYSSPSLVVQQQQQQQRQPSGAEAQAKVARSLQVHTFQTGKAANGDDDDQSSMNLTSYNRQLEASTPDTSNSSDSKSRRILRDRKLVEEQRFPFSYNEIVWMPVDEFNNVLASTTYSFTQKQRELLKDIRRRGKNKVAARNCRRRKVDQIDNLDETVRTMREKRESANSELQRMDDNIECAVQVLEVLRRSLAVGQR